MRLLGRDGFKQYVRAIVTRNNTVTGRRYCEDPTIMAWDLANEPFAPGDDTGRNLTARCVLHPMQQALPDTHPSPALLSLLRMQHHLPQALACCNCM